MKYQEHKSFRRYRKAQRRKTINCFKYAAGLNDVKSEVFFSHHLLLYPIQFERNAVLQRYIVDFLFQDRMLVVEIDEKHHQSQIEYDETRKNKIESWGFKVLRFSDLQIYNDVKFCIEQVLSEEFSEEKRIKCLQRQKFLNGILPWNRKSSPKISSPIIGKKLCGHGKIRKFCCQCRYH